MDWIAFIAWVLPEATPLKILAAVLMLVALRVLNNINSSLEAAKESIDALNINVALLLADKDRKNDDIAEIKRRVEKLEYIA